MTYFKLLRVNNYIKNFYIFLPAFFSGRILEYDIAISSAIAFVLFSLMASAIYIFNDLRDVEEDRKHPKKRFRPIASGAVQPRAALLTGIGLALNPLIESAIEKHQKDQAEFWIVSANFEPLIAAFCKRAGTYAYLCTRLEERDGKLTGRFLGPNCFGVEKVHRLEQHFPDRDQFSQVIAYGDSAGDLPMLQWADQGFLLKDHHWQKISN